MSLRSILNLGYAVLTEGMSPDERTTLDRRLAEPFDWELTPAERKRAEARRMMEARGMSEVPDDVARHMRRG